jgi:hypothetical protein
MLQGRVDLKFRITGSQGGHLSPVVSIQKEY